MFYNDPSVFDCAAAVAGGSPLSAVIVVPCYNEAKRLDAQAFETFVALVPNVSFLFVNDGSKDATETILQGIKERNAGRVEVLSLAQNQGKAEAVRQGLMAATTMGADVVGYWDADLATPLDAIEDFLRIAARMETAEVIFGSRRALLGHRINRTLGRRFVSRSCVALARVALALPVGDTQCGAKLLRVTDRLRAAVARPFGAAWLFDVELFSRLQRRDGSDAERFYEMPLHQWTEVPGSKVSAKAIVRAIGAMLRLIVSNRLLSAQV